jgi:glycosyltransferase involved in cell wall biosynthesis
VAVYAISKNEEKHVKRWFDSSSDADYHIIADTGSTDQTVQIARDLGISVYNININPWRFDDARNAALALVPADADYCIILDMDEILSPGWRTELQKVYDVGGITRPQHKIVTDFTADGKPAVQFYANRVHARNNYRWKYPIHEVITPYQLEVETTHEVDMQVWHYPDNDKSRGQYEYMLAEAYKENPTDPRVLYYYGRELFYHAKFLEAREIFLEYLKYTTFPAEKAYALRYLAKCTPKEAEEYLMQSIETFNCREGVLALANHYYIMKQWKECFLAAEEGMKITERYNNFMSEEWAWGHMAYDLAAISAWQLEDWDTALRYGEMALELSPEDERLQTNVTFYRSKSDANI